MVDGIVIDAQDVDNAKRPPGTLLGLPDELVEWASQNQALVRRVQDALSDTYATLTEEQVWEAVAGACSPEWRQARESLRTAEAQWDNLHHPENAALGLIGQALDSDEIDGVRQHYDLSLSHFTIINEGLRQRPDLANLLNVLLVQKKMLDQSADRTFKTLKATAELADLAPLRNEFNSVARKPTRLQKQFRLYAKKLFLPKSRQPQPAMNVIVPWLPGT